MAEATLPAASTAVEPAAIVEVVQAIGVPDVSQPALDLSDEIKEASIYVLLRALLDAASMLGSVNVVELAMWARWKMKYDTPTLAYPGPALPALPRGASEELLHWLNVSSAAYKYSRSEFCATSGIPMTDLVATDLRSSTMRPGAAAATSTTRAADGSGEVLLGVARLLASCMKQHPSYRVVVCGHSLGGGVAALLTMRLFYLLDFDAAAQAKCGFGIRVAQSPGGSTVPAADAQAPLTAPTVTVTMHDDDNEDGFVHVTSSPPASSSSSSLPGPAPPKSAWPLQPYPLHCFVFGPPPVASVDVCEHFEPHITSTVMGADFVPRVSMHMLHRLRREVHASRHLWWQDAVVDLAASRVGQLSTTAVQHMSHALLAAKDLSSAALGNLCYFLQQRFAGDGRASSAAPPSDTNAVQMQEADQTHSSSNATASSSPGGSSPGASSEASDVYVELARDFIRAQHPNSAAGAQVDELLRVGIQQGQPERVINSGDDILQREMGELDADQGGDPRAAGSDDSSDAAPSTPPPGRSGPDRDLADSPGSVGSDCELPLQVLSLPGTILHVTPHEDRQVFGYEARIVPPSHFEQMLFTHDMWQHHKRRLYGRALQWINLRDTPQPRVQMRLPAHLLPSPAAGAVGGSGRARAAHLAAQAKARATVLVPACAVPNQGTPFDAEAFLRSVVGSPANLGSAACSAAANDASDVMSEASPNSLQ